MKINDLYGLDDNIEHFVIHVAEEELASVKIKKVLIKKSPNSITFTFNVKRFDSNGSKGEQQDLMNKLQSRLDKFHKNFIKNVRINVIQD